MGSEFSGPYVKNRTIAQRPLWVNAALTIGAAALVAITLLLFTFNFFLTQNLKQQNEHETRETLNILAVTGSQAIITADFAHLEQMIDVLMGTSAEITAIDVSAYGESLLSKHKETQPQKDELLTATQDIIANGQTVGHVSVTRSPEILDELKAKNLSSLNSLVFFLMSIFAILITGMFYRLAIVPINLIHKTLVDHSDEHFQDLTKSPSLEVAKIAAATQNLQEAKQQIQIAAQEDQIFAQIMSISKPGLPCIEFLQRALDIIIDQTPWLQEQRQGAMFLAEEEGNLELVAYHNIDPPILKHCNKIPVGHCLCGKAAATRTTLFAPRIDERFDNRFSELKDHGQFSAPILHDGNLLGLLLVYVPAGHHTNEEETAFLNKITAALASVIIQKQYENKLRSTSEKLRQAKLDIEVSHQHVLHAEKLSSIGQLAAGIAHEINTPVQFVGDNTRFLDDAFNDLSELITHCDKIMESESVTDVTKEQVKKAKEIAEDIELDYLIEEIPNAISQSLEGVERISTIVQSMKEFSHPGSIDMAPCDLNKSILSTINVSRNEWKYCSDLTTDLDESLPLIPCLAGEFNQVVLNIIINATHAISDHFEGQEGCLGKIHISTTREDEFVAVRISDNGGGIPANIRNKLFDPFFTTKEVGKGTGQGLAIAHSVITVKHNGTIYVEVDEGVGSTFVIKLPVTQAPNNDKHQDKPVEEALVSEG